MNGWTVTDAGPVERGRRARVRSWLAVVCLFGGWSAPGAVVAEEKQASQAKDLPKAEVILDNMIEAVGGRAVMEKLHNRVTTATWEITGMGVKATITEYQAAPNKSYVVLQSEAIGKHEEGTDGTTCWEISSMSGPRLLEGTQKDFVLRLSTFNAPLHWSKLYPKIECVGLEDVEGKSCYKLVATPPTGQPETWHVDRDTSLLVKTELVYPSQMGPIQLALLPTDYKEVDGLLVAHTTTQRMIGQVRLTSITSIKHNVEMPADRFDLPAEIKALLEKPEKPEKP